MTEKQYVKDKNEKLANNMNVKDMPKQEVKQEKTETKVEEKKEVVETKVEEKVKKKPVVKKTEAVVNAMNLGISTKHSMALCDFVRWKNPEQVIPDLEKVIKLKKAIPMKGEIPHRKGGFPGRYPVNATKVFITLMKSLIANSNVNGIENPVIVLAKANRASRPHRRGGRERFKRTNVTLIVKEKQEKVKKDNKEKK